MSRRTVLAWSKASTWIRVRRIESLLFLGTFLVFALTASRSFLSLDVVSANYASWLLSASGSPFLDASSSTFLDDHPLRWVWVQDAPNGHTVVTRAPGVVIAGLPAYLISRPDTMSVLPAAMTAAAMTAAAVLLMFLALRSLMTERRALAAAAVFAFTTPVWSVAANGIWPQTLTVLGISVLAWSAVHERWWTMGLGGVLLLSARPHSAMIVAILGLTLAWGARRPSIVLRVGTPGFASLFLISAWTHWVYGSWNPTKLYGAGSFAEVDKSLLDFANQLAMWIAPDRGLLVFTPLLLVLLPALGRSWHSVPLWARTLLLAGLAYTLLQAAMIGFTGGDPIYGYRYGLEFLACAAPAFTVASMHVRGAAARVVGPVIGLQFVAILLGAVVERTALNYTEAWTANAFVNAMRGTPDLIPLAAVLGLGVAFVVDRGVRSEGRTSHPADADHVTAHEPVAG
jgi:hypothetical protein